MLIFGFKKVNLLSLAMLKCVESAGRLKSVRYLLFTNHQIKNQIAVTSNYRYYASNKNEGASSSSSSSSDSSSSDSSSDEEDEKHIHRSTEPQQNKVPSGIVHERLNSLLKSMSKNDQSVSSKLLQEVEKTETAKDTVVQTTPRYFDDRIKDAARKVAEHIDVDVKKIESELLSKLLSHREKEQEKDQPTKTSINLSELIVGMKIDRTPSSTPVSTSYSRTLFREQQPDVSTKFSKQRGSYKQEQYTRPTPTNDTRMRSRMPPTKLDLFGGQTLGIFKHSSELSPQPALETWQHLYQRELRLTVTHPPSNVFEEMIMWTEKGLLWKFPINNEEGLDEEKKVSFTEHVFLEKHLVPWCPTKGPIRHFMELVCVGLSKNPYLQVEEKKDTILWYRDYFQQKRDILQMAGVDYDAEAAIKNAGKSADV